MKEGVQPDLAEGAPNGDQAPLKGKGGKLFGGALTDEVMDSSQSVLRGHYDSKNVKGLQQFFSPPQASRLIGAVMKGASATLDLTAGNGSLLMPFHRSGRYGVEIDHDHASLGPYNAIYGDAQKVVPMLRAAGISFPAIAINPPFGLDWRDPKHSNGVLNSTPLAFLWALDLMDSFGQGVIIAGRDRLARTVMGRDEAEGVYAIVEVTDSLWDNVGLPTSIAFFVHPRNRQRFDSGFARYASTREDLEYLAPEIIERREKVTRLIQVYANRGNLQSTWNTVEAEYKRRQKATRDERAKNRYDVGLKGPKRIHARPGAYAKIALAKAARQREIELLDNQSLSYFGQNVRAWRQVQEAETNGWITVDPLLAGKVEQTLKEAELYSTPLFQLKDAMRLGWLTDLDKILCTKSDPAHGYVAGTEYPLSTRSAVISKNEERVVSTNKRGEPQLRQFIIERKLLQVQIGEGYNAPKFNESSESIGYLAEHFDLPDPGDVMSRHPAAVARARKVIEEIAEENDFERKGIAYKPFQIDHMSRLLTKMRGMLAHEQGLGKTLMEMTLARATVKMGAKNRVLFVVPQDLIPQWQREAMKFFGVTLEVIRNPAQARRVAKRLEAGGQGWFITYYEALSVVGKKTEKLPEAPLDPKVRLHLRLQEYKRKKHNRGPRISAIGEQGEEHVTYATTEDACPNCRADTAYGWDGETCERCHYVHRSLHAKSAYAQLTRCFKKGVICIDEISEMRGDSQRSRAIRGMAQGPYKYGGTGTPLSNYINDTFWGLWFCLGNASPAFPYDYHGKGKFEQDFCVIQHMLGRKGTDKAGKKQSKKILPEVTNVSQFWRLTQPGVSRCRKEQTGEPIVERMYHPIRVPLGVDQLKMNQFWLNNFASYFRWKYPEHPLVEHGLVDKWAAALGQQWRMETAATLPASDEPTREWPQAQEKLGAMSNWTPANLKVLELALEHAAKGEKVLIGSDLILTGKWLADRLVEKGVKAVHITEERQGRAATKNPRSRAKEVKQFYEGDAQVLCAGVNAIKLGHNLDVASCVIVHGLPFSFMMMDQFIARVHRLTSEKPVSIYVVIPKSSIAQKKWDLLKDKGGTSDLAFDGELLLHKEEAVDWNKILKEMRERGIRAEGDEVMETDVLKAWAKTKPLIVSPTYKTRPSSELFNIDEIVPPGKYVQAALF